MASLADAYKPNRRAGMEHSPRPMNPWPAVDRAAASLAQYIPSPTQGRRMSMDEAGNVYGSTAEENQLSSLVDFLAGTGAAPTAMARQTPGMLNAIGVWHGSPHKFDKFDLSKIGTGEGAQSYGTGLYFAENPEVARTYATDLINDSELPSARNDAEEYVLSKIRDYRKDVGASPDKMDIEDWMDSDYDSFDEVYKPSRAAPVDRDSVLSAMESVYSRLPEGHLYNVSLEWPDAAREAADPLKIGHFLDWHNGGQQRWIDAIKKHGSPEEAMRALYNEGIPGISYLDSESRSAGSGSRNFAVFHDSLAKILERQGVR